MEQGHSLAHHVTSHQCAVTVVVLQEGNKACRYRCNLLRRHVHEVYLGGLHHGEVGILATLYHIADKGSVFVQRRVALSDDVVFFFFGGKIHQVLVVEVYHTVSNLAIWGFDKA